MGLMTTGSASETLRIAHVLVPLDGSDFGDAAVPTARALASRFGARLHAISVAETEAEVEGLRAHATALLGADSDGDDVQVVTGGHPVDAIERRAAELAGCLVCLATHGRGRVASAVIGSVARSLLQRTEAPMVAVGPHVGGRETSSPTSPSAVLSVARLVACVDGSPFSEALLPAASAWAAALGMSLTILTVAEPINPPMRADGKWIRRHGPDTDADEYITRLVREWQRAGPDTSGQVVYDPISPADGLTAHLREHPAGLVAVNSHARSGLRGLLFGSTAASIARTSVAPTLVVPPPTLTR
jgi:nucleotide-binding universal stress UspA family protein